MGRLIAAVAIVALTYGPANSFFDDGNKLLELCRGGEDDRTCVGEIVGHYDMMEEIGYHCEGATHATKSQMRDVVLKFLDDHPALRNKHSAAALSFGAFTVAFSCRLRNSATP